MIIEKNVREFKAAVSRETIELLDCYESLLVRWNSRINLVSQASLQGLWGRHFLDSAQLLQYAPNRALTWADLGSGGGFPGIVIAIMQKPNESFQVILVESDQRKAAFLRTVIRECEIHAKVLSTRIEHVSPIDADVVSARALAPLSDLLGFASLHLAKNGVALFPKGARVDIEVAEALKKWSFSHEAFPSKTDPTASVLKIGDIKRV